MTVNMRKAKVGDTVIFRNGGKSVIEVNEPSGKDVIWLYFGAPQKALPTKEIPFDIVEVRP